MSKYNSLPLSQIAISSIDLQRSEIWWREGLGFLPSAHSRMFSGRTMSGVVRLDNAATTTRWLMGQDDWLQIEIWQYENPIPRLTLAESVPSRVGFRRCGVWVKAFDATLGRLSDLGSSTLTAPVGEVGARRVCIRDPDGIYVELFEKDPLQGRAAPAKYDCNAALRSVTLVTNNLAESIDFATRGLGLGQFEEEFHNNNDEALWGMTAAVCQRAVFISEAMLLEFVHYSLPVTLPRHPHTRLNDQGILNIAFGDRRSRQGVDDMALQTMKVGAIPSDSMQTPLGGCVYMTDPQGFSFEFMWARPGLGHRITGYSPVNSNSYRHAANISIQQSIWLNDEVDSVFSRLSKFQTISPWLGEASIDIINQGQDADNYVGFERLVKTRLFNIREQVTEWQPGRAFRYRLLKHPMLKNYSAAVECVAENNGTRVYWSIIFRSNIFGLGTLLKWLIRLKLGRLLNSL